MARTKKRKVAVKDIQGFKYLELLEPFLERLCGVGTERDVAGNRDLYFDQYNDCVASALSATLQETAICISTNITIVWRRH